MCNLNLIMRKNKKDTSNISHLMNVISYQSFQSNPHGDGFFGINSKGLRFKKSLNKIKYSGKYWLLSTHQRYATSGTTDDSMSHPFITKHLIIQHNGIFTGLGDDVNSDTKIYSQMLEDAYVECDMDLLKALRKLHKQVDGWFSIVVYERNSKQVYYYKGSSSSITAVNSKNYIILSTDEKNVEYAKWYLGIKNYDFKVESGVLYNVTKDMKYIGEFKEKLVKSWKSVYYGKFENDDGTPLTDDYDGYYYGGEK